MNIYNRPANRFVAEFVGSPGMNFIEGKFDAASRSFTSDALSLTLEESQLARLNAHERVTFGIRPEHIEVSTGKRAGWLPASVYVTELMGNETFVFLRLGSEKIIARAPADFRAEMESRVWIQLDVQKALFFDSDTGQAIRK
jgi:ABC-type sugar transport system ATPase subunit